jgi:hypothetical protein
MNSVLVPKEVLEKVLDYLWEDEQKDYQECASNPDWSEKDLEQHIFSFIKQLQDCVNDQ